MSAPNDPRTPARSSPTEARQGRVVGGGVVAKILGASLLMIVVAFLILYLFFFE